MRQYAGIALVIALGLAVGCQSAGDSASTSEEDELGALLRSAILDVVRSPERVECFPVENLMDPDELPDSQDPAALSMDTDLPGSFRIVQEPVPVVPELAAKLSALLLARESYESFVTFCMFEPGIAFRFSRGTAAVDVLVCFKCEELAFQVVGARESLSGRMLFEPVRETLAQFVREARPDDERFQSLKQAAQRTP